MCRLEVILPAIARGLKAVARLGLLGIGIAHGRALLDADHVATPRLKHQRFDRVVLGAQPG